MAVTNAHLIFRREVEKQIGDIVIDVFISETHTRNAQITEYPVEDGVNISDHRHKNPLELEIEGLISEASIIDKIGGSKARVLDGYEQLKDVYDKNELISVVTGIEVYENMLISNFSIDRDKNTGGGLFFKMTLMQVNIVELQFAYIPSKKLGGAPQVKKQTQPTVDLGKVNSGQGKEAGFLDRVNDSVTRTLGI